MCAPPEPDRLFVSTLEPKKPSIDKFYALGTRGLMDYASLKLWKRVGREVRRNLHDSNTSKSGDAGLNFTWRRPSKPD